jgi:hypothetical protein
MIVHGIHDNNDMLCVDADEPLTCPFEVSFEKVMVVQT